MWHLFVFSFACIKIQNVIKHVYFPEEIIHINMTLFAVLNDKIITYIIHLCYAYIVLQQKSHMVAVSRRHCG